MHEILSCSAQIRSIETAFRGPNAKSVPPPTRTESEEKTEEELLAEALARSMDPAEQESQFVKDLLK